MAADRSAIPTPPAEVESNTSTQPTKKKKPPKPGSKAARLLSASKTATTTPTFTPPKVTLTTVPFGTPTPHPQPNVIILSFTDAKSLALGLGRPHVKYEGGKELRGPLKGINMPVSVLPDWVADVGVGELTDAERVVLDLIGLKCQPAKSDGAAMGISAVPIADPEATHAEIPSVTTIAELSLNSTAPSTPTYLIAHLLTDKSTLLHEYAHAFYYLSSSYRAEAHRLWEELDDATRITITKGLAFWNYAPEVVVDEFQAYVIEGPGEFGKKCAGRLGEAHRILRKLVGTVPVIR
ncbi:hypothetical protein HDV00_010341 [Rhizophlyctis rosea]|nr:hypothetical protein HDV00_010341 [Rhizophlyctis rosea]